MRAQSARGGRSAARVAILLSLASALVVASPSPLPATSYIVRHLDAAGRVELRRLHELAQKARGAEREERWLEAGRFALFRARSLSFPPAPDDPEIVKVLREAGKQLSPSALAALAAHGTHPVVSEAFARALLDGPGPRGVPGPAEAAAEARDAIASFAGAQRKAFVEVAARGTPAARGAGGAHRSVYSLLVLGDDLSDSTASSFAFAQGLRAGVAAGAGAWSSRFVVIAREGGTSPSAALVTTPSALRATNPGVVAVAGSAAAWTVASALGRAQGFVVADARAPGDVEPGEEWAFGRWHAALESEVQDRSVEFFPAGSPAYRAFNPDGEVRLPAHEEEFRPFQLRPSSVEVGRRLAEAVASRSEIRHVAIAVPQEGGDLDLAAAFLGALRGSGRKGDVLAYEPGRRNYGPEAARFAATGAEAILFAGPGEESGEWLAALSARKAKPLVLGTRELDPSGFHAGQVRLLEGAIFAGEDWEDRSPEILTRLPRADSMVVGGDYRRGFRFGWVVARSVVEGDYTPTSLRLALDALSHPRPMGQFARHLVAVTRTVTPTRPTEVVLPLFVVRGGSAVPFEIR